MGTNKRDRKKSKKTLDKSLPKRPPGRPATVDASAVMGTADNWRGIFSYIWDAFWPSFSTAQSEDDVCDALKKAREYEGEFKPLARLMLEVKNHPKFPKRNADARINFLADSIAGRGIVTARRSRDICAEERAKQEKEHHILRVEYYVECSCGHKGPSLDHACRKCGARISEDWGYP